MTPSTSIPPPPSPRICILGAGPSGLAMARALLDMDLHNFVIYDRQQQIGGNWTLDDASGHSSVYEGVRSISSKKRMAFSGFAFSAETPDYPNRHELLVYLHDFVSQFHIEPHLQLATEVTTVSPEGQTWRVNLASGSSSLFDAVCICNGHHAQPSLPDLPGEFSGHLMHSHDFQTSFPFGGQRALVIGGGNSAVDIAADLARRSGHATLSLRRRYHVVPRHLFGIPSDEFYAWFHRVPSAVLSRVAPLLFRLARGRAGRHLPRPDHRLFQTHPLINSELPGLIASGAIRVQGAVAHVDGKTVTFEDGSRTDFDLIVACTGYEISFPFLALPRTDQPPATALYLRIFHPGHKGLLFLGLIQPNGSIWPLADLQAGLAAKHLAGRFALPSDAAAQAETDAASTLRNYVSSSRHAIEVDFFRYRRTLQRYLEQTR